MSHHPLNLVEDNADEVVNLILVLCVGILGESVGGYHADRQGAMAEVGCQAGEGGTLHLEVGDAVPVPAEALYLLVAMGVGEGYADFPSLGTIEPSAGNSDTLHHPPGRVVYAVQEFPVVVHNVR